MRWTPWETTALERMHAGGVPVAQMAERIGRSRTAVLQRLTEIEAAEARRDARRARDAREWAALVESVTALERAVDRRIAQS
jgi:DNA-binding Lrp family transcriptional regulator